MSSYQMNPYDDNNPYAYSATTVADAGVDEQTVFLRKTYLHLLGAVLAFVGLLVMWFKTGLASDVVMTMFSGTWSWVIVMGAFLVVSYVANRWASNATSMTMQYAGLGLFVFAESIIFLPILYIINRFFPPEQAQNIITTSALATLVLFGGLTATILLTRADVTFMGKFLWFGGISMFGIAIIAAIMGTSLGVWFPILGALLMCGYILYETSAMLHVMRPGQHVAAALMLFSSLATLFYYILRIAMEFSRED
jgi:FtsH-binding integral membrane protein